MGTDGRGLGRNDDVRPGQKDPLLVVRLAAGGEYKVRVGSSDANTSGVYNLKVWRFVSDPLKAGERKTGLLGMTAAHWYRLPAEAGRTIVVTARAATFKPVVAVLF